jgi:hypothetical protein
MPNAKCQMANGKCQMPNGKWQMANAKCQMPNAKCQMPNAKCQSLLIAGAGARVRGCSLSNDAYERSEHATAIWHLPFGILN